MNRVTLNIDGSPIIREILEIKTILIVMMEETKDENQRKEFWSKFDEKYNKVVSDYLALQDGHKS